MTLQDSIDYTVLSFAAYAENHKHWSVSFSGGKDSSATLAITMYLIDAGLIKRPETLTVIYCDTGLELLPLHHTAMQILAEVEKRGAKVLVVRPELDKRFFVYMFGRGVPPPNPTFRYCTGNLKIAPMIKALKAIREDAGEKFLSLIGVRIGESAARDDRIAIACGKDAECGQGYYQETTPAHVADVMAPIIHWRVCHVWDLLQGFGPDHGLPTAPIAQIYGQGTEYEEAASRTGCTACNVTSHDHSLDKVLRIPEWEYLKPLKRLRPLYKELGSPIRRLRKTEPERNADGQLVKNLHRLGPMLMDTRLWGLEQVMTIQYEINREADRLGRPLISLISPEERVRIMELIESNTWPNKWTGEEDAGDVLHDFVMPDGSVQPLLVDPRSMMTD